MSEQIEASGGISAFWLKIIAITGMFLSHAAHALPGVIPFPIELIMQISGGFTFPILAFLLVQGFHATSNLKKYMIRIAIFGVISIIPHMFVYLSGMNIMFTLLIGLAILKFRRDYGNNWKFWLIFAGLTLVSAFFDWGIIGPITIFLFDAIKNDKARRIVPPIVFASGITAMTVAIMLLVVVVVVIAAVLAQMVGTDISELMAYAADGEAAGSIAGLFLPVGSLLSIPLLLMYKGERGRPMKWFFYAFYPVHFIVLAVVSLALGVNPLISFIRNMFGSL